MGGGRAMSDHQRSSWKRLFRHLTPAILALAIAGSVVLDVYPPQLLSLIDNLPLHMFMEGFAIVVSMLVFSTGWHSYSQERAGNIALLASFFLAVGLLDFAHMLSFPSMPDFVTPNNPQKTLIFSLGETFFWNLALFSVVVLPWKPFSSKRIRYGILAANMGLVALFYWVGLYHQAWFPEMFIPDKGLTPFKAGMDVFAASLQFAAVLILLIRLRHTLPFQAVSFIVAAMFMGMSKLCFTVYLSFNDLFNLLGHLFKIVAYFYIYRGVFVDQVEEPFRRLHQSEEALRKSEEWLATTLRSIHDAVIATDTNGAVTFLNPAAERLTGYKLAEAAGKSIREVLELERAGHSEHPVMEVLRKGLELEFADRVFVAKDGKVLSVEGSVAPIRDRGRNVVGSVLTIRDITERIRAEEYKTRAVSERKKTEELLRKSERLKAVREMAAGVAHEIRNPLTAIRGFVQLMQGQQYESQHQKYLEIMLAEIDRINLIVSELLVLAKPQMIHFQQKDLSQLMQNVIVLLDTQAILHNIRIESEFDPDIPPIHCEENQIKQLLINLLKNAIEAMPDGGTIRLEVKRNDHDTVLIRIMDQGAGIPKEHLPKLGEPFYTTKEKGTGLGLMISYKIVEAHRGKLQIASELNRGTTVDVVLPIALKSFQ